MGQVDLTIRKHRNAPESTLARMAMQIQRTVHERLVRRDAGAAQVAIDEDFTQYARSPTGGFERIVTSIGHAERPPMASISRTSSRR